MIKSIINGRINLLGSPSDVYAGRVINSTINDLRTESVTRENDECRYFLNNYQSEELEVLGEAVNSYLSDNNIIIDSYDFRANTTIPKQADLGFNTSMIACLIGSLNRLFYLGMSEKDVAFHTSMIEKKKMGLTTGLGDGFSVVYGGTKFMDFNSQNYKEFIIEDVQASMPLWVGIRARNTNIYDIHKYALASYSKDAELQKVINEISSLTLKGKEALRNNDVKTFGSLMNENARLNSKYLSLGMPSEDVIIQKLIDEELINACIKNGSTGAKMGASNGSVLVLGERPDFLKEFRLSPELSKRAMRFGIKPGEQLIKEVLQLKAGPKNF